MVLETDIRKQFTGFSLNLSFSAGSGCLGILGPSGCGKSMTLKSIAGIIRPDSGKIILHRERERVFFDKEKRICLPPQKRRVGYLFQHYALFPNMTVEENILTGLAAKKEGGSRVRQLIRQFRLEGLEKHYPAQMSGGQQQRTALARIFACAPDILLLDEPFSAMDAFLREGLRLELAGVLNGFPGVSIMVTHDRDEVFQLCPHLLLMDKGRVLAAGGTKEIFRNPGSCQAARLTGCKNISRIERLGKYRVRALDWKGLELTTEAPVGDTIQAIGIRAHDLEGLSDAQAESWKGDLRGNLIPMGNPKVAESPFCWQITLENGLWWKKEKTMYTHDAAGILPDWLRVEPSMILLLEDR